MEWSLIAQIIVALIVAVVFNCIFLYGYKKISGFSGKNGRFLCGKVFVRSIYYLLTLFIWVIAVTFILQLINNQVFFGAFSGEISVCKKVVIILLSVRLLFICVKNIEHRYVDKKFDETTVHLISQLMRIVIVVVVVLAALQTFGVPISSVIAFGGVGGIILGFAAKDMLSNFFGVFMIHLDRPFSIGDLIKSPDRNIEGYVEYIGWRLTKIRTLDKQPLYVPNSIFSTIAVQNLSRMTNRRVYATIMIRHEDVLKISSITREIREMLENNSEIDSDNIIMVYLFEFGQFSLNIYIDAYTKTTNRKKFEVIREDIFIKAVGIIHKNGANLAFPIFHSEISKEI